MKFTFLFVDKTHAKIWQATEAEYLERLSHFVKYEIKIIPPIKNKTPHECIRLESKKLIEHLNKSNNYIVILDKSGKTPSSEEMAAKLELWQSQSKNITFVIGGTFGLSKESVQKATFVWSLSNLTFTHEMVRTIMFEQLYRAFTIIKDLPYHY